MTPTRYLALVGFVLALSATVTTEPTHSERIRALFAKPPREYSTAPLWVWNDVLTDEMVAARCGTWPAQNVQQVFVHPRPGLMTPYLSEEWFRLWKVALKEAERLDMNLWIYDENSYPSRIRRRLRAGGDAGVARARPGASRRPSSAAVVGATCWPCSASTTGRYARTSARTSRPARRCRPARYLVASQLRAKPAPGTAAGPTSTCCTRA